MLKLTALAALVVALALPARALADADLDQVEPTDTVIALADQVGVDPFDLQGAVNTSRLDGRSYLVTIGLLAPPVPPSLREYAYATYPSARRIECIAGIESGGWFTRGWNPIPWGRWGEHASGLGGFLPSTWSTTPQGRAGASIWDGYAQVDAIAWMLNVGRGREFAGVAWGRC